MSNEAYAVLPLLRLSQKDVERLGKLAQRRPGSSRTALAQEAVQIGLAALERELGAKEPGPSPVDPQQPEAARSVSPRRTEVARAGNPLEQPEPGETPPENTRANLQRLKSRLDKLESQVKDFFDSQASSKGTSSRGPARRS